MELVDLGESGLRASRVGLGCNNFGGRIDLDATRAVVDAALEVGVTFLDTAAIYGNGGDSERYIGEILEGRREQVVLATKFGWGDDAGDGSAANVRRSIDESLERLRTDHVDLYYLHKPDPSTPIAETLGALDELVRIGKVRAIGCSNFSAAQLAEADRVARELGGGAVQRAPEPLQRYPRATTTRTSCHSAGSSACRTSRTSRSPAAS